MKAAVAALTLVVALSAGVAAQAHPRHHHRHQVCSMHHHHRICHWR